jgi:hypothetical protein
MRLGLWIIVAATVIATVIASAESKEHISADGPKSAPGTGVPSTHQADNELHNKKLFSEEAMARFHER